VAAEKGEAITWVEPRVASPIPRSIRLCESGTKARSQPKFILNSF
jgi:hypothetical protein